MNPAPLDASAALAAIRTLALSTASGAWPVLGDLLGPRLPDPLLPTALLPVAGGLAGGGDPEALVGVAAGIVLMDLSLRIVDDVSDEDDATALHLRLGMGPAVNVALALAALGTRLLVTTGAHHEIEPLTSALVEVCHGQHLDMTGDTSTLAGYRDVTAHKTAAAFSYAMAAGARAAGASRSEIDAVSQCGSHVGSAVQILNDIESLWFDATGHDPELTTFPVLTALTFGAHPRHPHLAVLAGQRPDRRALCEVLDDMQVRPSLLGDVLDHRDAALAALGRCRDPRGRQLVGAWFDWLLADAATLAGVR